MSGKMSVLNMPIEVCSEAGLWIATEGDGNRQRFADVFRGAWKDIPAADRQVMVHYWSKGIVGQIHSPRIDLLTDYDRPGNNDGFGNVLLFNSCVVELLDKADLLSALIAHELGHVYCYATNSLAHGAFPPTIPAKEDEADATATTWGYDMQTLRTWTNENAEEMAGCGIHIPAGGRW